MEENTHLGEKQILLTKRSSSRVAPGATSSHPKSFVELLVYAKHHLSGSLKTPLQPWGNAAWSSCGSMGEKKPERLQELPPLTR